MVTTGQTIPKSEGAHAGWEPSTKISTANANAVLVDANAKSLFFRIDQYKDVSIQLVNTHNTTDIVVIPYVSNFIDPGTGIGADSNWVQAKDEDGADLSITVSATGTPATNEIYHLAGRYKWLALCGSSSPALTEALDIGLIFIRK